MMWQQQLSRGHRLCPLSWPQRSSAKINKTKQNSTQPVTPLAAHWLLVLLPLPLLLPQRQWKPLGTHPASRCR